ncbi:MAG: substrate-binding domain-containing protein [Lentisphaeria bacterium]|nr:substrate-binding domain-containing protein [Lentisphaeria bacterium]
MKKPKRVLYASQWWLEDQMGCVAREAAQRHWHINFQMCVTNRLPRRWRGDGIITTFSAPIEEEAAFLKQANCPAVALNQYHRDIDVPYVSLDMTAAGQLAAGHFLERGFRHFAHYTRSSWQATKLPYLPFEKRVAEHGGTVARLDWAAVKGCWGETWEGRHDWLRHRLRTLPKPLAVLAVEPLAAVEVIEAALEEGLDVPDQVAVLGLFDISFFRECATVGLSCIIQDFEKQVRTACDLLARMMDGEPAPSNPILLPPAGITTRRSTDTIAAHMPEVAKAIRYLRRNYAAPVSVDQLADICDVSRTRLYDVFDADLGQSPHALLTRIRLDKAKKMLLETDEKIRAIAEACGFGSVVNLHRHFKSDLGMTPGAYRKRAEGGGAEAG